MKRCTSVFFFFDDDDITFKDMILSEAKERSYKVTTKQYSRQGEATIITPNTTGDTMTEIYENEGIKLLYAEGYEYFEVFGLSNDEFEGLKNWANYFVKRINK